MSITKLSIELDDTVKDNELFKSKLEFEICKPEIFKYGVLVDEVPSHIKESDFEYLQSKIPGYELLYSDFINVLPTQIENLSKDDRKKKIISEVIGVAFGIKYSVELLNTNPNKFTKIGVPADGKYLDYSIVLDNKEYELETKGTVNKYYSAFKKDILEKKSNAGLKKVYLRYGTIAMINNPRDTKISKCVIVDDPPNENNINNEDNLFQTQLLNYAMFLSYILDSKYYNKYINPLKNKKIKRVKINDKKFYTKYNFKGKDYYGECFDYRLIRDNFKDFTLSDIEILTKSQKVRFGKTKIFIGLDKDVIDAINTKNREFLVNYSSKWQYIDELKVIKFLDRDGILFVKSIEGSDQQLETIFPEEEVAKRIGQSFNQYFGISHKCGAPCRSKELRGKPCEINTFRNQCHFHR